jgi:hypothetical protein
LSSTDLQTSVELKKYKQSMRRILGYNHNHHWKGLSLPEALKIFCKSTNTNLEQKRGFQQPQKNSIWQATINRKTYEAIVRSNQKGQPVEGAIATINGKSYPEDRA